MGVISCGLHFMSFGMGPARLGMGGGGKGIGSISSALYSGALWTVWYSEVTNGLTGKVSCEFLGAYDLIGDISLRLLGADSLIGEVSLRLFGAHGLIGDVSLRLFGASLFKRDQSSSE